MDLDTVTIWVGRVTVVTLIIIILALMLVGLIVAFLHWFPRFNVGKPNNPIKLTVIDPRQIITTKDGVKSLVPPAPRIIRELNVLWWFGISHRPKAKWFIGVMRWEEMP